ncbi:FtsX-like permease family protein [Clostridium saudiense]|uniref:FtsX-like permease family protein n=1 Tax=Clostridium saudiense TaxID=1414720 RepID=UPI00266EB35D|nr:ABC transporter permease [Clostridium saudiense]
MYSKIAAKNIRKSFKDFTIYFLTLTFAVCIFYCFNSLDSQMALSNMKGIQVSYVGVMNQLMAGVSVFVSVILAGLIIFATNFLIKRRKKEFGLYMMLGMSKWKISFILFIETLIVGIVSLVIGLVVGLLLSQGLSILTANMFLVDLDKFRFTISNDAIIKTISYFGIIYLIVMIFNLIVISKYKLIDLINSSKKSEKIKVRNKVVSLIILVLSIIVLIVAYRCAIINDLDFTKPLFFIAILLGIIGTLGFFFGLSSSILAFLKNKESVYFNKLNVFTIKQITSKFNTNFISMTVICLMLFVTIGILTSGLSIKKSFETTLEKCTPYDFSAVLYKDNETSNIPIVDALKKLNINLDDSTDYEKINLYSIDYSRRNMLSKYIGKETQFINVNDEFLKTDAMSISDYNKAMKLAGNKEKYLAEDEVYISADYDAIMSLVEDFVKDNNSITIDNKIYKIKDNKILKEAYQTTPMSNNMITLVLPDSFFDGMIPDRELINYNYVGSNSESKREEINNIIDKVIEDEMNGEELQGELAELHLSGMSREIAFTFSIGMSTIILFISIYIGIVFLLSSAAVLAIQQLSQCNESIDRYEALKKIGASKKQINRSILLEVLTFFTLPLSLAIVHSIIGIGIVENYIKNFGEFNIYGSALLTALIFVVVYGGYFYATYIGYRNVIEN